jgi:ArsR family transcriptional regulator, arsenate/arsenite/antimonite-responsive transcriptional repressor
VPAGAVPGRIPAQLYLHYHPLMDLSSVLKALADPNRLRIMNLLEEGTLCVCDLEAILELNQSNLSRHLARLKQAGVVAAEKKALFTYYSRTPLPEPYGPIIDELCATVHEDPAWEKDRARLAKRLASSKNSCC